MLIPFVEITGMNSESKQCHLCQDTKSISAFYVKDSYKGKTRYDKLCKLCRNATKRPKSAINTATQFNSSSVPFTNKGLESSMYRPLLSLNEQEYAMLVNAFLLLDIWKHELHD